MSVAKERKDLEKFLQEETDLAKYDGWQWYQLSAEEARIFDLKIEEMPKLSTVFDLYFGAIRVGSSLSEQRCASLRQELDWLKKCSPSEGEWQRFAALFGVSNRQADAFYCKHNFWEVREGLVTYGDEREKGLGKAPGKSQ